MKKTIAILLTLVLALSLAATAFADEKTDKKLKDLEKRLRKVEVKAATDRVDLTGDFRFEAHNIRAEIPDHIDGMAMQGMMVPAIWLGLHGMDSWSMATADDRLDYMQYLQGLTYEQLQSDMMTLMSGMTPAQIAGFNQMLAQAAFTEGYKADNDILYTSRLRLNMKSKVAENVSFAGRLSMYKAWGDATGVQVFNGQQNSMNIDGNTTSVPNSDILRVDRAYFDWRHFGFEDMYLSIGRRPSTSGPPLHFRQDEMRAGTPLGSVIDMQFDGITLGYRLTDWSMLRGCYGLGFESGFGNGELLKQPADRLKDAHFFGFNWDVYSKDETFVQATVARAFDVTDGFNGLVVMPVDPLTGQASPGPMVMRYSPSANLGDIDVGSVLLQRTDGPVDWFASYSFMKSHPNEVTTPFGGLFSDPFSAPEEQDGSMFYLGARYNFDNEKTKLGVEYNKGSEYWFNFAVAADDLIGAKTATRGSVFEIYVTHRIAKKFIAKLDFINYAYDYSGTGWHLGAPKDLDDTPVLGFPTYDSASKISLSLSARF